MNCGLIDEDKPKIEKTDFLFRYLGEEKFEKLKASLKTWSAEKGIPMYVLPFPFLLVRWSDLGWFCPPGPESPFLHWVIAAAGS